MHMSNPDTRPVYLNLLKIKQPVTALLSIAHRISGVLLFLALPLCLYLFEHSLQGPAEYGEVRNLVGSPAAISAVLVILWMLLLHFLAGVRFLLMDIDRGVALATARRTATLALWLAPAITVMVLLVMLV